MSELPAGAIEVFLSTPSARRATRTTGKYVMFRKYFYPRPPRGGRRRNMLQAMVNEAFLSTPSARRATIAGTALAAVIGFLSTPSARRATSGWMNFQRIQITFLSTPSARRATQDLPLR